MRAEEENRPLSSLDTRPAAVHRTGLPSGPVDLSDADERPAIQLLATVGQSWPCLPFSTSGVSRTIQSSGAVESADGQALDLSSRRRGIVMGVVVVVRRCGNLQQGRLCYMSNTWCTRDWFIGKPTDPAPLSLHMEILGATYRIVHV